jgi:hypothetical protein
VATPDNPCTRAFGRRDERRRLRVVDDDHVSRTDVGKQPLGVVVQDVLEVPSFGRTELAAVSGRPVEPVVDPFRDREEGRIPFDHEPPGIDARAACVGEKRLQHLRHTASGPGRVDVQYRPAGERRPRQVSRPLESRHPLGADQRREPGRIDGPHVDLVQPRCVGGSHAYGPRA